MEGLRAQFGAKLGPLPVWAWALLAVLAVVGWMYVTHSGFFSNTAADSTPGPQDTTGDQGVGSNTLPVGLGGLAGGGTTDSASAANPISGYYDPGLGAFVGQGSSDANIGSSASSSGGILDLSGGTGGQAANPPPIFVQGAHGGLFNPANIPQSTSIPALNQFNPVSAYGRGN